MYHEMRWTLEKIAKRLDPAADYGEHHFTYCLFPHTGSWDERTQAAAYALNDSAIGWVAGKQSKAVAKAIEPRSFVSVLKPNVIVETVKRAEDGPGVILRLYESQRKRCKSEILFPVPVKAAWITDLLEENVSLLQLLDDGLSLELKPYQIVTLRVLF